MKQNQLMRLQMSFTLFFTMMVSSSFSIQAQKQADVDIFKTNISFYPFHLSLPVKEMNLEIFYHPKRRWNDATGCFQNYWELWLWVGHYENGKKIPYGSIWIDERKYKLKYFSPKIISFHEKNYGELKEDEEEGFVLTHYISGDENQRIEFSKYRSGNSYIEWYRGTVKLRPFGMLGAISLDSYNYEKIKKIFLDNAKRYNINIK